MARKRLILKPSDEQQRQLEFITSALNIDAREFLLSVIPVHYDELCRMISNGLPSHNTEVPSDS
jgi:hypothetical protein